MYIIVCLKFVIVYEVYIPNGSVYIPNGSDNQKFKRKTVIISYPSVELCVFNETILMIIRKNI